LPLKAFDITLLNHRGGMDREVFLGGVFGLVLYSMACVALRAVIPRKNIDKTDRLKS
jgi:hypothetical protein